MGGDGGGGGREGWCVYMSERVGHRLRQFAGIDSLLIPCEAWRSRLSGIVSDTCLYLLSYFTDLFVLDFET